MLVLRRVNGHSAMIDSKPKPFPMSQSAESSFVQSIQRNVTTHATTRFLQLFSLDPI